MTTIELKEYEEKKESELQGLDLVGFRKYLNRQKLNSVIEVYSDSIKSSQWVGVIKYKKTIIQILPIVYYFVPIVLIFCYFYL